MWKVAPGDGAFFLGKAEAIRAYANDPGLCKTGDRPAPPLHYDAGPTPCLAEMPGHPVHRHSKPAGFAWKGGATERVRGGILTHVAANVAQSATTKSAMTRDRPDVYIAMSTQVRPRCPAKRVAVCCIDKG